ELQEITHNLVGIIRTESELADAISKISQIRGRIENVSVTGGRLFNPGFHLSFDLDNMLLVAEATAKSAIVRKESRGGHTRDDFPKMDPKWRALNNITSFNGKEVVVKQQPLPDMPKELFDLFDIHELEKYLSSDELAKGGR
ncbi:MAG: fumarate reductase/succinate dehydrogenase flavoprotein subunit, partial [Actinobacteria bacterium]|nr:fumarate reductase/succinate dehydrogenase flavoprotein subunit [Actinomycetota bacterium]